MTDVDAPTMPANCRFVVVLVVAGLLVGATLVLLAGEAFGAAWREPDPSSLMGLARVRFWSPDGLTSIGGSGSEAADCCAWAAETPNEMNGTRKLVASRKLRRGCA